MILGALLNDIEDIEDSSPVVVEVCLLLNDISVRSDSWKSKTHKYIFYTPSSWHNLASVQTGATKGLAVLNKYYAKTDESVMYRCAMSMCYLLSYMFLNHTNSHPTWQYFIPGINWHTSG